MNTETSGLKWYVVYTRPQSERIVASGITNLGIESYLPTYEVVRQWRDRKKKLSVPLFPNYVFVRVTEAMRGYLFSIKELVKFVSIERKPVVVRDTEITMIKKILSENAEDRCFDEGILFYRSG
jgi:transcription antitermination factor NusG